MSKQTNPQRKYTLYLWLRSKVWIRALKRVFKPPRLKSQIQIISFSEFIYLFKHSLVRTATASKAIAAAAVATAAFGFSLCPCNMGV